MGKKLMTYTGRMITIKVEVIVKYLFQFFNCQITTVYYKFTSRVVSIFFLQFNTFLTLNIVPSFNRSHPGPPSIPSFLYFCCLIHTYA